ncbi:lipase family protein [Sorangium sp. So ce429]
MSDTEAGSIPEPVEAANDRFDALLDALKSAIEAAEDARGDDDTQASRNDTAKRKRIAAAIEAAEATEAEKAKKAGNACQEALMPSPPLFPDLVKRLQDVKPAVYDEVAAYVLAVASSWSYANRDQLEGAMRYLGFHEKNNQIDIVSETINNGALLIDTTVSCLRVGKVVILCFRGTQPLSLLTWLSNLTFAMDRFYTWGNVHSGFLQSLTPLWPRIVSWLRDSLGTGELGSSILSVRPDFARSAMRAVRQGKNVEADDGLPEEFLGSKTPVDGEGRVDLRDLKASGTLAEPMEALYICGHSLGAAQAVIATAMIYQRPEYSCLREKLRGVYCYGQPLVGDQEFSEECQKQFGDRLFRHIYEGDIITRFPPKLYGAFTSFGQEYVSTPEGWTHRKMTAGQTYTLVASVVLGVYAWVAEQVPILRSGRVLTDWVLRSLNLPVLSLADHSPHKYMQCSQRSIPFYR